MPFLDIYLWVWSIKVKSMSSYIERYYGPHFSLMWSNISVSVNTQDLKASLKSGQSLKWVKTFLDGYLPLQ